MTTVQSIIDYMAQTQLRVERVTGITREEQNARLFDAAEQWLERNGCTGEWQTSMMSTPAFWTFWKQEWQALDVKFLQHHDRWNTGHQARAFYEHFHHVANGLIDRSGNGYHQVIKHLARQTNM